MLPAVGEFFSKVVDVDVDYSKRKIIVRGADLSDFFR